MLLGPEGADDDVAGGVEEVVFEGEVELVELVELGGRVEVGGAGAALTVRLYASRYLPLAPHVSVLLPGHTPLQ